jgi:hypothetical protein
MSAMTNQQGAGRNPILSAGSRIPPWAALSVVVFLIACWLMAETLDDIASMTRGTWWLALAFVVLAAIPQRVEVGAEGMRVSWLGAPRLVRYDAVTRAAPIGDDDVFLVLRSGESLRLQSPFFADATARMVLSKIWRALAAGAEDRVVPHEHAMLARSGRTIEEWSVALASIAPAGAQYRQSIPLERLLAIASNPAVDGEIRAAAGVAAASALDAATRTKLEEIAAQAADDRIRVPLGRIAAARTPEDLRVALASIG